MYRGVCARVAKAIFGQQAGAAAVAMVNNATGYPPFEGKITSNPDDGTPFTVTIPFFGVKGSATFPVPASTDGGKLYAASGGTAAVSPTTLPNANYKGFADFSSGGPRTGDSWLKPDVTAPGVSVTSTLVGSGNEGTIALRDLDGLSGRRGDRRTRQAGSSEMEFSRDQGRDREHR